MKKVWVFFFLIANLFVNFSLAFALDLSITQYPESPREGEEVKFTLQSDKYDLDTASTTWLVDGEVADSGIGRKTLSVKAPQNGLTQIIAVTVEQEGFNPGQAQKVLEANTNFILYEGVDSYVPSFYKGRRLPAKEGNVRAAFFSFKDGNISGLDSSDSANYVWKVNGEENTPLSGVNRIVNNILTRVTDDVLNLSVSKETANQAPKIAEAVVPLQKTEVIVYKTDENKLLKQVLGDTETAKKIFLLVEPFFFSIPDKTSKDLVYTWKINDIESKISTPWSVVFSGKDRDSVQINLNIVNNKKITQENSRGFTFKVE